MMMVMMVMMVMMALGAGESRGDLLRAASLQSHGCSPGHAGGASGVRGWARHDLQVNVLNCNPIVRASINADEINAGGDFIIYACGEDQIEIENLH